MGDIKEGGISRYLTTRKIRKMGLNDWELLDHEYIPSLVSGSFGIKKGDVKISYMMHRLQWRTIVKSGDKSFSYRGGHEVITLAECIYENITGHRLMSNPKFWERNK